MIALQRHLRIAALFLCSTLLVLTRISAPAADVRIEHVTIVSPERATPLKNATVSIHDGKVVRISSGRAQHGSGTDLKVIDGSGLYLAPGLIDSHVHLASLAGMTPEQEKLHPDIATAARNQVPRSFLFFGFTTLIDLISTPDVMERWNSQEIVPDTYYCGGAALIDGYPMVYAPKPARYDYWPYMIVESGDASSLPAGVEAAAHTPEAVVARMKSDGAICAKTFFERGFGDQRNLPVPRLETIQALVRAAHAAGLPVLLHANALEAQKFGLDAGVDVIAHGLWNWGDASSTTELTPPVKAVLDRVVSQNVGWQPTIEVVAGLQNLVNPSFLSNPMLKRALPPALIEWYGTKEGRWFHDEMTSEVPPSKNGGESADARMNAVFGLLVARVERATRYLAEKHARLLFGTDTPSAPIYSNPPGLNGWFEMQRLVEAGVTPAQIFKAATLSNAQALGLDKEIGTVQVGKRANLLLLRHDPTQSIEAYDGIAKVILRGRVLDPTELVATRDK